MNELNLFSGAGGGCLASKMLGWRTVGYVEWDEYCQRILARRQAEGWLDVAPIFGDVRAFVSEGYARSYRGVAQVVSGGFPCQPFSHFGKKLADMDSRNMWPATRDVLEAVRPEFAFLENVPGLCLMGYFGRIILDLAEIGYCCRWGTLSAAHVGGKHIRDRLWIIARNVRNTNEGIPTKIQEISDQMEESVGSGDGGWWVFSIPNSPNG